MENLSFSSPIVLIGAGEVDTQLLTELQSFNWPLIAVDGGANVFHQENLVPQAIIGDLDSISEVKFFAEKSKIILIEDQNSTDLEKALDTTTAPLYLCLGFIGSRFDHSLTIMHILSKYADYNLLFFSEEDVILRPPANWQASFPISTRISFYPLQKTKVLSSNGLKYPLNGLEFEQGKLIGTSNETIAPQISIEQQQSGLAAILPKNFYPQFLTSQP